MAVVGVVFLHMFACFPQYIYKKNAAMITKLDIQFFHDRWVLYYWKLIDSGSRSRVAKNIAGVGLCTLVNAGL